MLLTEFNEKKYRKLMMQEGREEGREIGREEGILIGRREGEEKLNQLNMLYAYLLQANRLSDLKRAMEDTKYRQQLFEEYEAHK